jgi:hypothetical protein
MAETRLLAPLLRLVDEARGKAILVGDPEQIPSVGAGGLYAALCEHLGSTGLTQNRRQHDVGEEIALARLRSGDAEPYLAHAATRGRLQVVDDPLLAKQRLLEDWWHWASRDLDGTIMLAHRREDVRKLSDGARRLMLHGGRLGDGAVTLGGREFRVGDRTTDGSASATAPAARWSTSTSAQSRSRCERIPASYIPCRRTTAESTSSTATL